jgi:HEAT repeat protein
MAILSILILLLGIAGGVTWWLWPREDLVKLVKDLESRDAKVCRAAVQKLGEKGPDAQSAVPDLIPLLADEEVREAVVAALDKIGPPRDADASSKLMKFLYDQKHPRVRAYAARFLADEKGPPPPPPPGLLEALKKTWEEGRDTAVRRDVLKALIRFGAEDTEHVVPVLLDALDDSDDQIKATGLLHGLADAKFALGGVRHKDKVIRVRVLMVIRHLVAYRSVRVLALLEALDDRDELVAKEARTGLADIGPLTVKDDFHVLKQVVNHRNPDVRELALKTIAVPDASDRAFVVRALVSALDDKVEKVRVTGLDGLITIGLDGKRDVALVQDLDLVHHKYAAVRELALKTIAVPDTPDRAFVVHALLSALDDKVENVKKTANAGLDGVRLNGKRDWNVLKEFVAHKNPKVLLRVLPAIATPDVPERAVAIRALFAALGNRKEKEVREVAFSGLTAIGLDGTEDFGVLKESITHPNPDVRNVTAKALAKVAVIEEGKAKLTEQAALLAKVLEKDQESELRRIALAAFTNYTPNPTSKELVRPILRAALSDNNEHLSRDALKAIKLLGLPLSTEVPILETLLFKNQTPEARSYAAFALGQLGPSTPEAREPLLGALDDDSVGATAVEGIGTIPLDGEVDFAFVKYLTLRPRNTAAREMAVKVLSKALSKSELTEQAALLAHVLEKDQEPKIRLMALATLKLLKKPMLKLPELVKLTRTDEPFEARVYAAFALGQLGPDAQEAVPDLALALDDMEEEVQQVCVQALTNIGSGAAAAAPRLAKLAREKKQLRRLTLGALVAIGRTAASVTALHEALQDPEEPVRLFAADSLMRLPFGQNEDLAALARALLGETTLAVRRRIVAGLPEAFATAKVGKVEGIANDLGTALDKEPEADIRRGIVTSLASIGPPAKSAIPSIIGALTRLDRDKDAWDKVTTAPSDQYDDAEKIEAQKLEVFLTALKSMGEEGVKEKAVEVLRKRLFLQTGEVPDSPDTLFKRWLAAYTLGRLAKYVARAEVSLLVKVKDKLDDMRRKDREPPILKEAAMRAYHLITQAK